MNRAECTRDRVELEILEQPPKVDRFADWRASSAVLAVEQVERVRSESSHGDDLLLLIACEELMGR